MFTFIFATLLAASPYLPQDGDIIFHTSLSSQSQAIQIATQSPYSHVGIVYLQEGKAYVYEAIRTVSLTPLKQWVARGKDKAFMVMRLKQELGHYQKKKLRAAGHRYKALAYDLKFEWSNSKMYCSELVWKIYNDIGIGLTPTRPMKDYHFDHPKVQKKLQERWGKSIHWEEPIVAPCDLAKSSLLRKVYDSRKPGPT